MKNKKAANTIRLTPDSQNRLVAYSTAASLGAFFAGQTVEAQLVESSAFTYPVSLNVGTGAAGYNYINIDGAGNDFNLDVSPKRVTLGSEASGDNALNPSTSGYIIPWTSGTTISSSTGSVPNYKKWLAEDSQSAGTFAFNNFPTTKIMGFEFASGGNEYFGYMDIQITASDPVAGQASTFTSATISGLYYNETPNTAVVAGSVPSPVPEPSSLALLAVGAAGMAARRVRRLRR